MMNKQVEYVLKRRRDNAACNARQALNDLFYQAREKDRNAILEYAQLVCEHVGNLNSLIESHSELLLPFSSNCLSWPMRISKRKVFGDDTDDLIQKLKVGEGTIANDSAARFDPTKKFGWVAWNIIERIEGERKFSRHPSYPTPSWVTNLFLAPNWAKDARKLPKFTRQASPEEKKQWLAVVRQVLDDDFRNPKLASEYHHLVNSPSYKERWKPVFFNKVQGEFDSLWRLHSRKHKKSS